MDALSHLYPYEKDVMLNVLYDTLDSIGFRIEHANSERGTIIAVSSSPSQRSMRIALNGVPLKGESVISIFPEIEDDFGKQLSKVLFDEIASTIKQSIDRYDTNKPG